MRISHWTICALALIAAGGSALGQNASAGHFLPGQELDKFVIDQKVPPPRAPGPALKGLPDPFREDDNWAKMPAGRIWGGSSGNAIDRDGKSVWFVTRCDTPSTGCVLPEKQNIDPILKFDSSGKLVKSFGKGMFKFPHGIWVDKDDNIWIADGKAEGGVYTEQAKKNPKQFVGNTVKKFTQDGKLLMTLGKEGAIGDGTDPYVYRGAVAVAVSPTSGDIYVVDGHDVRGINRVIRYDSKGKFIQQWGKQGTGDMEFNPAHGFSFDSKGNMYVADRGNNAVKVFTQDGKLLHVWKNFGIVNGLAIDKNDRLYVADTNFAEPLPAPDFGVAGIRIADTKTGKLIADIPFGEDDTLEAVAVADDGTVYGGFTHKPGSHRWIPTGPLPK